MPVLRPSVRTARRLLSAAVLVLVALGLALAAPAAGSTARKPAAPPVPPVVQEDGDHAIREGELPAGPVGRPGGRVATGVAQGAGANGQQPRSAVAGGGGSRAAAPQAATGTQTLVLYDTTGEWGWLGESYATMSANLASQFGAWTAKPVSSYTAGEINQYTATIYVGSTYDEPLPTAFLDDVATASRPVIWLHHNIWQLTARRPDFQTAYGWMWAGYDLSAVDGVTYKGTRLTRDTRNAAGIMNYTAPLGEQVQVLATAHRTDGTSFPWAIRSRNLTYVGEIPFAYFSEGDRMTAFSDLLFDALDPGRPERHRALVRLEDVGPDSDPVELRAAADYLASRGVPFSFGVSPRYRDPRGFYSGGRAQDIPLNRRAQVVDAIRYLQSKGGVMLEHGWTHQYSNVVNPYSGVSGDDTEFYRVVENPDHTLSWVGPVPEDSPAWIRGRINSAARDFRNAGLTVPTIFEFPHYTGSATAYREVARFFATRYERTLYFAGTLHRGTVDHSRMAGQFFPYVVRDVYGTKVLPENLGNIEPVDWFQYPQRLPADIVRDAQRNLVVRDGFASFYFHPFFDLQYLRETVEGIQAAGYTFVSPTSL